MGSTQIQSNKRKGIKAITKKYIYPCPHQSQGVSTPLLQVQDSREIGVLPSGALLYP